MMQRANVRLVVLAVWAWVLFVPIASVRAHGGGQPRLVNEVAGAYLISAWTKIEPTDEGERLHITVAVADLDSAEPVLNEQVFVSAQSGRTVVERTPVTHEKSTNKLFYETDVLLVHGGVWTVDVEVQNESVAFEIETTGDAPASFPYLPAIVVFAVAALVGWNAPKLMSQKAAS